MTFGVVGIPSASGGSLADQYPSNPTADNVTLASSQRPVVTCTASATPHTEGSWVQVDASLLADCAGIFFCLTNNVSASGANGSTLLEIGTGGSGSEVVWAKVGVGYTTSSIAQFFVPGFIAAGTRVAVRARSAVVSQGINGIYTFLTAKSIVPAAPVTYGASNTTSHGVIVTPHASLNTKSAWTQITASTSAAHSNLLVCPQGAEGTNMAGSSVLIDIGIGAAASETVLIGDICLGGSTAETYFQRSPLTYGVSIPAGSRLSARYARANVNNAVDIVLVGA